MVVGFVIDCCALATVFGTFFDDDDDFVNRFGNNFFIDVLNGVFESFGIGNI